MMQSTVNGILSQTSSLSLLNKSVAAVIGIAAIYLTFRVLERTLPQRFGQANVRYRVRKFIVFCGYVTVLLFLAIPPRWVGQIAISVVRTESAE